MPKKVGPGPGAYLLPPTVGYAEHDVRKDRKPAFSFGYRTEVKEKQVGPGPAAYLLENNINRYGPDGTPKFSLAPRLDATKRDNIPGPGAHENHLCPSMTGRRPPAFSIAGRLSDKKKSEGPAPNAYTYGLDMYKPRQPSFSLGARIATPQNTRNSPGPAAYGETNKDATHPRSPSFSIKSRTPLPGDRNKIPAPNAYNLQGQSLGGPSFSFGMRYNEAVQPYIVEGDQC